MLQINPQASISPIQKLRTILIWARGLLYEGKFDKEFIKRIHDLVRTHCPATSWGVCCEDLFKLSAEFPDSYQLVVPASLYSGKIDAKTKESILDLKAKYLPAKYFGNDVRSIINQIAAILS